MFRVVFALVCVAAAAYAQEDDWELVWFDEFDGELIDSTKWQSEITAGGGGNEEFQVYNDDPMNTYIQDGKLFIKASLLADNTNPLTNQPFGEDFLTNGVLDLETMYGRCDVHEPSPDWESCYREGGRIPPTASGRLRSFEKFSFRYGRAIIRAKMPVGDWLWPALWLLPEDWAYGSGDWPESGEIDMQESIGNRDYVCDGSPRGMQHMGTTMHWGLNRGNNRWEWTHTSRDNLTHPFGEFFHEYRFDWSPQGIEFYLDDEKIMTVPGNALIDERTPDNCYTGWYDFGAPWFGDEAVDVWTEDVTCDHFMAPFDQPFHFILNVAVGGTTGFIPDDCVNAGGDENRQKPWRNFIPQVEGMWDFYDAKDFWYNSWISEGDNAAMQVDYVRVFKPKDGFPPTQVPEGCPEPPFTNNCL